jgi:excisionase family DNA binding protein
MATPSYARSRAVTRFPEVLDVHLAAQLLIVSADTIYALFQRGDLPGRKVGRKWLTTKTAVLKWLEHSAGLLATAALAAPWHAPLPRATQRRWSTRCRPAPPGSGRRSSPPRGNTRSGQLSVSWGHP